ncbi:MAG: alpha/beta fold hydrolase [Proteobacteria bacterium]|nr:alpha/beta fold hydrolase [Pseudomonadota bacterium]
MPAAAFEIIDTAGPKAPWLVIVHGVSQNRRAFSAQIPVFGATHRLMLIDLPGHGLSSAMPGPYGVAEYAESIAGAMRDAGAGDAVFWGTHLGAAAGLLLAVHDPDRFSALVLEGPVFPGRSMPGVSDVLARVADTARNEGMAAARKRWWEEGGWFAVMRDRPEECRAAAQRQIIEEFEGAPWLDAGLIGPITPPDDDLRQFRKPVLIMNGAYDLPDFLQAADEISALLPDCRRMTIKDGGGFPFWEFPGAVNAEVWAFLATL